MKIILSNCIKIESPTKKITEFVKKELTFTNSDYLKKKRMGFYAYGIPKEIKLYNEYNGSLYVPYGFFKKLYDFYPYKNDYVDYTTTKSIIIESGIKLRNYQEPGLKAIKEHYNGLFVLPCGLGKTESALQCVYELKQKAIWITHTRDLVNQAKERCEAKMKCKTSTITDGKIDTSGDIVFCTMQTLYKMIENGKINQNEFGMVIADECFPKGTKINTPNGYKNIEDIKIGDVVYSYNHDKNIIEEKHVNYLFNKKTDKLCNIMLENGENILCTINHPIYTNNGYVRADSIKKGDYLYEMQSMWERDKKGEFYTESVATQNSILQKKTNNILFKRLWKKREFEKIDTKKQDNTKTGNDRKQSNETKRSKRKNIKNIKRNETQTKNKRWKWLWFDNTSRNIIQTFTKRTYRMYNRVSNKNKNEKRKWVSNLLQSGYRYTNTQNSNRNRWAFPLSFIKTRTRQEKNNILRKLRVESVEIQERICNGEFGKDSTGIVVYNIGVEDNHNYFVDDKLVHNCHRIATNPSTIEMFRTCVDFFAARYKLGLTATLHRADGLEKCITAIIGDVIYEIKKDKNDYVSIYNNKEILRFPVDAFQVPACIKAINTTYNIDDKPVFDKNGSTIQYSSLISDLALNKERNKQIIKDLKGLKGSTIILSDRVEQLKYLCDNIENGVQIDGSTPKKVRTKALEDVRQGKIKYLFASYSLAKEGLDCTILSNLIMATPVKDFAIVTQSIGRIQRPYEGKKICYVYDYVDDVGMLLKFYSKRRATYRKNNWCIENVYLNN